MPLLPIDLVIGVFPDPLPVILIVDDDPLLRMVARDVVEDAGFAAVQARDADEAMAILESGKDITLLFTDIEMPGSMDGLKLAHAVRDRWPATIILLVSGRVLPQKSDLPSSSFFVQKPYGRAAMVAELRSHIGSSRY